MSLGEAGQDQHGQGGGPDDQHEIRVPSAVGEQGGQERPQRHHPPTHGQVTEGPAHDLQEGHGGEDDKGSLGYRALSVYICTKPR